MKKWGKDNKMVANKKIVLFFYQKNVSLLVSYNNFQKSHFLFMKVHSILVWYQSSIVKINYFQNWFVNWPVETCLTQNLALLFLSLSCQNTHIFAIFFLQYEYICTWLFPLPTIPWHCALSKKLNVTYLSWW